MARQNVTLRMHCYWDRDNPDGSRCLYCDDQCFLSMWRMFYRVEKFVGVTPTKHVLCESCHQAVMEN